MFITFEGGDASGKTTQIRLLAEFLEGQGVPVLVTREPGGTALGEQVRGLLLSSERDVIVPLTEVLLFAASRAQIVREVIRPALAAGRVVLCDRFTDSTLAYQGFGLGMDMTLLREVNRLATGGLVPDLTVLLDLDPAAAEERSRARGEGPDRISSRDADFKDRVRAGYITLAREDPGRFAILDASGGADDLARLIRERVEPLVAAAVKGGVPGA